MTIRALVLDFDGLILDTETPMRQSWMEIYEAAELSVSEEQWAALLGSSPEPEAAYAMLEKHVGHAIDREALRLVRMQHELELLMEEVPLPGVVSLIEEARAADFGLAVASSSERKWVEGLLAAHSLLDAFDAVVCAEDVATTKPAPDLFLAALEALGAPPADALAFEDSLHGMTAAKAAGIFVVAVPNRVTRCLDFSSADLVLDSLADISLFELLNRVEEAQRGAEN